MVDKYAFFLGPLLSAAGKAARVALKNPLATGALGFMAGRMLAKRQQKQPQMQGQNQPIQITVRRD